MPLVFKSRRLKMPRKKYQKRIRQIRTRFPQKLLDTHLSWAGLIPFELRDPASNMQSRPKFTSHLSSFNRELGNQTERGHRKLPNALRDTDPSEPQSSFRKWPFLHEFAWPWETALVTSYFRKRKHEGGKRVRENSLKIGGIEGTARGNEKVHFRLEKIEFFLSFFLSWKGG